MESKSPRDIFCLLGDIGRVLKLAILGNNVNRIISWWKIYSNFKYIIFDEGLV